MSLCSSWVEQAVALVQVPVVVVAPEPVVDADVVPEVDVDADVVPEPDVDAGAVPEPDADVLAKVTALPTTLLPSRNSMRVKYLTLILHLKYKIYYESKLLQYIY